MVAMQIMKTLLLIDKDLQPPSKVTYCNKCPVAKVICNAEEPELVKEQVCPSNSALIWGAKKEQLKVEGLK